MPMEIASPTPKLNGHPIGKAMSVESAAAPALAKTRRTHTLTSLKDNPFQTKGKQVLA